MRYEIHYDLGDGSAVDEVAAHNSEDAVAAWWRRHSKSSPTVTRIVLCSARPPADIEVRVETKPRSGYVPGFEDPAIARAVALVVRYYQEEGVGWNVAFDQGDAERVGRDWEIDVRMSLDLLASKGYLTRHGTLYRPTDGLVAALRPADRRLRA